MKAVVSLLIGFSFPFITLAKNVDLENLKMISGPGTIRAMNSEELSNINEDDIELTRRVRDDLSRSASLYIYSRTIDVITVKGEVTLRGLVRSATERAQILSLVCDHVKQSKLHDELVVVQR